MCRQHINWTIPDWGNVMFTEELSFVLQPNEKRVNVGREVGTRNRPQYIPEYEAFRGGIIIVWAGISLGYRNGLHIIRRGSMTTVRYRDEVLRPTMRLYTAAVSPVFLLTDVNARPYGAVIVEIYVQSEVIARKDWRRARPTLITLKVFGMPSVMLCAHISNP